MESKAVWTTVVLVFVLLAVVSPIFVMPVKASPKMIYVDATNVNDPGEDGSLLHPFPLIQKGVDAASPGDTVYVFAGVYYESVQINKSFISLVGEKGGTIIDGNGTDLVGIRLYHSSPEYTENVSISGFTVRNFSGTLGKGITLSRSIYARFRDNSMVGNTYNFGDYTLQVHDIDTSNTVDGKPIYYWVNQRDKQVPAEAGFVALVGSTNITVRDMTFTSNVQGLVLKNTTHSLIENVRALNNWDGMYLARWSNSNKVIGSTFSSNLFMGIYVSTSSSNIIVNNSISSNAYGLLLDSSVYETVLGNVVSGNTVRDNIVMGNTVANSNLDGVYLDGCRDNVFFHNHFVNNMRQVESLNSTTNWNDGAEGNYWGDYSGKDLDMDGFGDAPYMIDENNKDGHPLMGLFSDFPFVWEEETYHVSTISNSTVSEYFFSKPNKTISFSVDGPVGGIGFCRVSMPVSLLGGPYTLVLNGSNSTSFLEKSNGTRCFLYFTYDYSSLKVKIEGTSVVPEFPSFPSLSFLAVLTVGVAIVALARKRLAPALFG